MRSIQKSQKNSSHQLLLDQYLTLKPHRAVERLLQQNNLQQCFELYNMLQQNVKSNTSQLRSVLYNKHQNLHECSQIIHKIQDFASKVKNVQNSIDSLLKTEIIEAHLDLHQQKHINPISKIEELMDEKRFSLALNYCHKVLRNSSQKSSSDNYNSYYIKFLKVEIINKLQDQLQNTSLSGDMINESIETLKQFMTISSVDQIFEIIQKGSPSLSQPVIGYSSNQTQSTSILQLLYEKCMQVTNIEQNYPLQEELIIQTIFKFKLLSLKSSSQQDSFKQIESSSESRVNYLYHKVFNYFSDLLKILDEVQIKYFQYQRKEEMNQQRKQVGLSKLYQIFNSNIQKTVNHISQLFIINKKKISPNGNKPQKRLEDQNQNSPTLSFENELYEKLLESKEFLDVLQFLSNHFAQANSFSQTEENNDRILSIIKNLWKDFYHQMLDIISQKINPCSLYTVQSSNLQYVPEQFHRFSVIPFEKIAKQRLQAYLKQLNVFFSNFKELLSKSKTIDEKKSIINYFLKLKIQIELQCRDEVKKLEQKLQLRVDEKKLKNRTLYEFEIKGIMILFILSQSYNIAWTTEFQNETQLFTKLMEIDNRSYKCETFHITLFSQVSQNESPISNFYRIINNYIDLQTASCHLLNTDYIQRWQQKLDTLFASYHAVVKENDLLKSQLKHLILALIKTKLQSLANN